MEPLGLTTICIHLARYGHYHALILWLSQGVGRCWVAERGESFLTVSSVSVPASAPEWCATGVYPGFRHASQPDEVWEIGMQVSTQTFRHRRRSNRCFRWVQM